VPTKCLPPNSSYSVICKQHNTKTVVPTLWHQQCGTNTVVPKLAQLHCGTNTVVPTLRYEQCGTNTAVPTLCYQNYFQYRSALNLSVVDIHFFSASHTLISKFFNMPPLEICRPGPAPCGPCVITACFQSVPICSNIYTTKYNHKQSTNNHPFPTFTQHHYIKQAEILHAVHTALRQSADPSGQSIGG
jgi:hypothetical protein